ncbi:hypothetical protein [Peribacillus alkalitolerans]|uniref:hypothetical protein n=1 Tax=Peribacillus alkalitolerans TaxID=1550385 RepID=UPI0013D6B20C|nr:hypothetical protein [Peribacillus alkalitolerans]
MKNKFIMFASISILSLFSIFLFSSNIFSKSPEVKIREAFYIYDVTDKKKLVGNSEHLFIAKELSK